jgi:ABC-2 type transport system ATP-binding protein
MREMICEIMLAQKNKGKTIFFSTHIISDIEKVGDFIILINNGEILFNKSKEQLLDEYSEKLLNPTLENIMLDRVGGTL